MTTSRTIRNTIAAVRTVEGGGFIVHRPFPTRMLMDFDPFLLLDEMGPVDYAPGAAKGAPDHPHRGFETVTYMLAGRMRHGDNHGHSGLLGPGSVQWMTAGRGIVHSEMPEQEDGLMWGFQLWVNLPAKDKMTAPRYQEIAPEAIPLVELPGGTTARVIAGALAGTAGPIRGIATDPLLLDLDIPAGGGATVPLPEGHNAFLYPFLGTVAVGEAKTVLPRGTAAVLGEGEGEGVSVAAVEGPARVLLAAGRPLGEPVARYGPFVMNTQAEIRQAIADFQSDRF
jgi:redox-sensitive bicupin YhaK (pirin superfamily)